MKLRLPFSLASIPLLLAARSLAADVVVDPGADRRPISPYVYGANQIEGSSVRFTAHRLGGNRLTGYNWENGLSNAGSDWEHSSDTFLCSSAGLDETRCAEPGAVAAAFGTQALDAGAYPLVTLQMAGYVSADGDGTVTEAETAPSARWHPVVAAKGAPFTRRPDPDDDRVYMDELVSFLVGRFGGAAAGGVRGYALDNEPDLWSSTHPRIHPDPVGARELVERSAALAAAVKAVDPDAEIFGLVSYGYGGFVDLQSAPDWERERGAHGWYTEYFLAELAAASAAAGTRLLDVLDLHFYSEARQNGVRVQSGPTENAGARGQSTRSLWDPSYGFSADDPTAGENSWITEWNDPIALIPRMLEQIERNYPGTRLALTEYDFGAADHVSGGIAQADALGIFGREGLYLATRWGEPGSYTDAAYRLYLDYDGNGAAFGSTSVRAISSDVIAVPACAAVDDTHLHLVLINRDLSAAQTAAVTIAGPTAYLDGEVWGFDGDSARITSRGAVTVRDNAFTLELPALSAYHVVLSPEGGSTGEGGATGSGGATSSGSASTSGGAAASGATASGGASGLVGFGDDVKDDGGCGCRAAPRRHAPTWTLAALALGAVARRRRRR